MLRPTRRSGRQPTRPKSAFRGHPLRAFATNYPARFAVAAYAALNLLFAGLFALPIASADGQAVPPIDALFTAVSVITVTGLSTVLMAEQWSPFGDALTLIGAEIGGIGVLTLTSFMGMLISRRLGLQQRLMAASESNSGRVQRGVVSEAQSIRLGDMTSLLRLIVLSVVTLEALLFVPLLIAILSHGTPLPNALYEALFWSVMSFTNSGFSPTPEGLVPYAFDPFFLMVVALGVFVGSLGFPVYFVIIRNLRRPRRWSLHAKLTIGISALLVVLGALGFAFFEYDNPATWGQLTPGQRLTHAIFGSVMTRSGGFASLGTDQLTPGSMMLSCVLMFIGGGSASTAGGIKVTTLAVLVLAALAEAQGRKDLEAFGRRIPTDILRLAVSVTLWGAAVVTLVTLLLLRLTNASFEDALFDAISAFGTVGLSSGLTGPDLFWGAKLLLALTMFTGRIGGVTLAAALAAKHQSRMYALPEERPLVG